MGNRKTKIHFRFDLPVPKAVLLRRVLEMRRPQARVRVRGRRLVLVIRASARCPNEVLRLLPNMRRIPIELRAAELDRFCVQPADESADEACSRCSVLT